MGRWGYGGGYSRYGGGGGGGGKKTVPTCYRCGHKGHYKPDCFAQIHKDGYALGGSSSSSPPSTGSRKKAKTDDDAPKSDFTFPLLGHTVSMNMVKKKGGANEGKILATIRGPKKSSKFYAKDAAEVRTVADRVLRQAGATDTDEQAAPAATATVTAASGTTATAASVSPVPATRVAAALMTPPPLITPSRSTSTPSAATAALLSVSPQAAAASGWTQDEMADAFAAEDDSEDLASALRVLATATLSIVGIQYYSGIAHPKEYVSLVREPRNPYDSNAVRVENMDGQKVGHVKGTQVKVLAPVMDAMARFGVSKLDGSIPSAGDGWKLPLKLEFLGPHDRSGPGGTMPGQVLTDYLRGRVRGAFRVEYSAISPPSILSEGAAASSASSMPMTPAVQVNTSVVVKEFKSQEELDTMFEQQQAKLTKLPTIESPPQLRSTSKLLEHQKVGVAWMAHKETGGGGSGVTGKGDEEDVPFFKKVQEKGRAVWLSEITNASQKSRPPAVRGCILADDMGLGKTLQCISLILTNPPEGHEYPLGTEGGEEEDSSSGVKKEITEEEDDDDGDKKMPAAKSPPATAAAPMASPPPGADESDCSGSNCSGGKPEASPQPQAPQAPPPAAPTAEALAAARSINKTKINAVPVKKLRWILSSDHVLGTTTPYVHGLDPMTVLKGTKKPELVKLCLGQLQAGQMSAERFEAGAAAVEEPPPPKAAGIAPAAAVVKMETAPADSVASSAAASTSSPAVAIAPVVVKAEIQPADAAPTTPPNPYAASASASKAVATKAKKSVQAVRLLPNGNSNSKNNNVATVIVCPVSVMSNWVHQIEQHVKDGVLRVGVYQGAGRRAMLPDILADKYDVVVVSFSTLAADFKADTTTDPPKDSAAAASKKKRKLDADGPSLFDMNLHRVVLDEAHQVRNSKTRAFKAVKALTCDRRVCLTGTPLQNKPEDVQSLFAFLGFAPLADADVFRRAVAQPIKDGDGAGLSRLRLAMCHVALRRNKQNTDIALKEKEVQIRSITMEPGSVHRQTYDVLFESARAAFRATLAVSDKEALKNYMSILETLMRIRQACCSGALIPRERIRRAEEVMREIDARSKTGKPLTAEEGKALFEKLKGKFEESGGDGHDVECSVCLEELPMDGAAILRSCSHFFCQGCVQKLLKQSPKLCPLCRGPFVDSDVTKTSALSAAMTAELKAPPEEARLESIADAAVEELELSPKVRALLAAVTEMEADEKGVIFSQFTKFLDVIEKALRAHGHSYTRIDGRTKASDRITAMRVFNSDSGGPRFILCSLMAAGTGINLTRANHVFMCDLWWNQAVEDQAMDRCHRIGQTRKVRILKFVIADSIEERLIKMQEAKAALGKGAMQLLNADEMRKTRIGALKDLFLISSDNQKE